MSWQRLNYLTRGSSVSGGGRLSSRLRWVEGATVAWLRGFRGFVVC